jgi:hypothetical protein
MKQKIAGLYRSVFKKDIVFFDYTFAPKPRYASGHPQLKGIIAGQEDVYRSLIDEFLQHKEVFHTLEAGSSKSPNLPHYNNGFLPGLDIVALYGMVSKLKSRTYFEIGSGNSTKVARLAIQNSGATTKVVSLDPQPREEINQISDEIIRKPLQAFPDFSFIVDALGEGDILFYDGTHVAAPDSDVVAFFLDILPRLKKGVVVQIHDIYLPFDYPQFMCDRYYSEQYLLAAMLISNPSRYKTIFPAFYVDSTPTLRKLLDPVFEHPRLSSVERHGGSYWLQITED